MHNLILYVILVYFLDILPTANYISKMNSNILEKYEFVVDKIKLYEIQTKEDFEKKYVPKIINLYYSLNKDYVVENETIMNIIRTFFPLALVVRIKNLC